MQCLRSILCTEILKAIFITNISTMNTYKYKFLEFTKHRKHHQKGGNIKLRLKYVLIVFHFFFLFNITTFLILKINCKFLISSSQPNTPTAIMRILDFCLPLKSMQLISNFPLRAMQTVASALTS